MPSFKASRKNKPKEETGKPHPPTIPTESCCSAISSEGIETHTILTEDEYILTLFRIKPKFTKESDSKLHLTPVLMIPGLFNGGTEWFAGMEDETKSLPYKLTQDGYDCWMGCVRGTPNSRGHVSLKNTSKKYWDFSLDEMAKIDIPTFIDYILKETGHKDLCYVGYSMGGAMIMASLVMKPEYSEKVRLIAALAPGVYGHHFQTAFNKVMIPLGSSLRHSKCLYSRPIGTKSVSEVLKKAIPSCCCKKVKRESLGGWIVKHAGIMQGPVVKKCGTDREMYNRIAEMLPASTSVKHVSHVAQCFTSKKFRAFNYGPATNMKKYGQRKPPTYDLNKVTVPVATWTSSHDYLVPAQDVAQAASELPNLISHHQITETRLSHADFLFGKETHSLIYQEILDIFNKYNAPLSESSQEESDKSDNTQTIIDEDRNKIAI